MSATDFALLALCAVLVARCGTSPTSSSNGGATGGSGGATSGGFTTIGGSGFAPAAHPAIPTVVSLGGPIYAKPTLVPIYYDGDNNKTELDGFLAELAASDYWTNAVSEYQVGALAIGDAITLGGPAAKNISDAALQGILADNLGGSSPAWGAPTAEGLYVFFIPSGSVVTASDATVCCQDFDGYHDEARIGPSASVAYAIVCDCPGFDGDGIGEPDQMTIAAAHEISEAATDPLVESNPAYYQTDAVHGDCTAITGGEIADMCEFNPGAYVQPTGLSHLVQQIYSNAAAAAGTDPCLPLPGAAVPYFNSIAVLPNTTNLAGYGPSESVNIGVGQSRTIEVKLFSSAPTSGAWTVSAHGYYSGDTAHLSFSWNKTTGQNGDTLQLTVQVLSTDSDYNGELFILESTLGGQTNLSYGAVGPI